MQTTRCETCQSVLPDDARFCRRCGHLIQGSNVATQISVDTQINTGTQLIEETQISDKIPTINLNTLAHENTPTIPLINLDDEDIPALFNTSHISYQEQEAKEEEERRDRAFFFLDIPPDFPHGKAPSVPGTPHLGSAPSVPGTPHLGGAPSVPGTPHLGGAPSVPGTPHLGNGSGSFHQSQHPGNSQQPNVPHPSNQPQPDNQHSGNQPQPGNQHSGNQPQPGNPQPPLGQNSGNPPYNPWGQSPLPPFSPLPFPRPLPAPPKSKKHIFIPQNIFFFSISFMLILALIIWLLSQLMLPPVSAAPVLTIPSLNGGGAYPGSSLILQGSHFLPGGVVTFFENGHSLAYLDHSVSTFTGQEMSTLPLAQTFSASNQQVQLPSTPVTVQTDGTFATSIQLPRNWKPLTLHKIVASENINGQTASAQVPITVKSPPISKLKPTATPTATTTPNTPTVTIPTPTTTIPRPANPNTPAKQTTTPIPPPTWSVNPGNLDPSSSNCAGNLPWSCTITLTEDSNSQTSLAWSASAAGLNVSPSSGSLSPGEQQQVTISGLLCQGATLTFQGSNGATSQSLSWSCNLPPASGSAYFDGCTYQAGNGWSCNVLLVPSSGNQMNWVWNASASGIDGVTMNPTSGSLALNDVAGISVTIPDTVCPASEVINVTGAYNPATWNCSAPALTAAPSSSLFDNTNCVSNGEASTTCTITLSSDSSQQGGLIWSVGSLPDGMNVSDTSGTLYPGQQASLQVTVTSSAAYFPYFNLYTSTSGDTVSFSLNDY